ncbi:MAG: VacJ family lipoprotein [Gammaproteobacteria bacterium]|nr:VacJ family lipoprotein [Gammaproteobacteria bacterium]
MYEFFVQLPAFSLIRVKARWSLRVLLCLVLLPVFMLPGESALAQVQDPWINANQRIFRFNNFFDAILVRPVANTYTVVIPRFARQGIGNFFSNINDINVLVNDVLQLKMDAALTDSGRFLINTTIGLGGFMDVASSMGLQKNEEDFGQTLGYWGVGTGPYIVLPVFGTSNARDSFGFVLDTLFNPIQYQDDVPMRLSLLTMQEIDTRSSLLALDELVGGNRYLFFREAYMQRREYLVNDGAIEEDFGEFGEF